jgi:plasmid replication initiation protein
MIYLHSSSCQSKNLQLKVISIGVTLVTEFDFTSENIKLVVSKSNSLTGGQAKLSARQSKLLALCIAKVNPINPARDREGYMYVEMTHDEISNLLDHPRKEIKRFIIDACEALHTMPIHLPSDGADDPDGSVVNIAHKSTPTTRDGNFKIQFHPDMEQHIVSLLSANGYTKYDYFRIRDMRSRNSIKIYELIVRAYNRKKGGYQITRISLHDLLFATGMIDSNGKPLPERKTYASVYSEFNRCVIKVGVAEINRGNEFHVQYKPYKSGRSVVGITFVIGPSKNRENLPIVEENVFSKLKNLGIAEEVSVKFLSKYPEDVLERNINFLMSKKAEGLSIKSNLGFVKYLVNYDVAALPEVVNPYSTVYSSDPHAIAFIQKCVVPMWRDLPAQLKLEVEAIGIPVHPATGQSFREFKSFAKSGSLEDAMYLYTPDTVKEEWVAEYTEISKNQTIS